MENVERSFKWFMENRFPELAATVDAMNGNDKGKGVVAVQRSARTRAFVDACNGQTGAVQWLVKARGKDLLLIARELDERRKSATRISSGFLNLGNPFR